MKKYLCIWLCVCFVFFLGGVFCGRILTDFVFGSGWSKYSYEKVHVDHVLRFNKDYLSFLNRCDLAGVDFSSRERLDKTVKSCSIRFVVPTGRWQRSIVILNEDGVVWSADAPEDSLKSKIGRQEVIRLLMEFYKEGFFSISTGRMELEAFLISNKPLLWHGTGSDCWVTEIQVTLNGISHVVVLHDLSGKQESFPTLSQLSVISNCEKKLHEAVLK